MPKAARQEEILRFLQTRQCVSVQEICGAVFASPATIRRDLRAMEEEKLVRLFHGGVMLARQDRRDVPLAVREYENPKIKSAIAKKAAELLPPGASVMLDASSTALYVANELSPSQELTVFTNCLRTAVALAEKNIRTYCLGGGINRLALSTGGSLAEENIRLVQVDYLLFSSQGLDWDGAITDYSEDETKLRRLMMRHSKKRYFLCDSDKVGQRMLFNVCAADALDGVISDADVSRIPGIRWIPAEG